MSARILIHPDLFYSSHSGAIAAREAARQLSVLNHEIGVFTHDPENRDVAVYKYYRRLQYTGTANYFSARYRESILKVIEDFKPDFMFFIGGIVNTPLVYLDMCRQNSIKTVFLLLIQDFFCARLHAGLNAGSCTKCLTGSNFHAFANKCADKQTRPFLYLINYQVGQQLFLSRLRRIDFVLGSSDEQLDFYLRAGIEKTKIVKIPLFFDQSRIIGNREQSEPYFVIIGQYRHEKGIHLISSILNHVRDGITVKLLLYNDHEATCFLEEFPENRKHIEGGKLEVLPGVTMANGAIDLISRSKGVINPSIWATTTEFVLLEVLGLSKPVFTFDVGIHKEVIRHRVNGICVRAGDFKAMGDEINNMIDDPALESVIAPEANRLYHQLTDPSSFKSILDRIFL